MEKKNNQDLYTEQYLKNLSNGVGLSGLNGNDNSQIKPGQPINQVGVDNIDELMESAGPMDFLGDAWSGAKSVQRVAARNTVGVVDMAITNLKNVGTALYNQGKTISPDDNNSAQYDDRQIPENDFTRALLGDSYFDKDYKNIFEEVVPAALSVGTMALGSKFPDRADAINKKVAEGDNIYSELLGDFKVSKGLQAYGSDQLGEVVGLDEESNYNYAIGAAMGLINVAGFGGRTKALKDMAVEIAGIDSADEIAKYLGKKTTFGDTTNNVLAKQLSSITDKAEVEEILNKKTLDQLISNETLPIADLKIDKAKYTKEQVQKEFSDRVIAAFKPEGKASKTKQLTESNMGDERAFLADVWLTTKANRDLVDSMVKKGVDTTGTKAKKNLFKEYTPEQYAKAFKQSEDKFTKEGLTGVKLKNAINRDVAIRTNPELANGLVGFRDAITKSKSVSADEVKTIATKDKSKAYRTNRKVLPEAIRESLDTFNSTQVKDVRSLKSADGTGIKKLIKTSTTQEARALTDSISDIFYKEQGEVADIMEKMKAFGIEESISGEMMLENGVRLKNVQQIFRTKDGILSDIVMEAEVNKISESYTKWTPLEVGADGNPQLLGDVNNRKFGLDATKAKFLDTMADLGNSLTMAKFRMEKIGMGWMFDDVKDSFRRSLTIKQDAKQYLRDKDLLTGTKSTPIAQMLSKDKKDVFNYQVTKVVNLPKTHPQYIKYSDLSDKSRAFIDAQRKFDEETLLKKYAEYRKQGVDIGFRAEGFPMQGKKAFVEDKITKGTSSNPIKSGGTVITDNPHQTTATSANEANLLKQHSDEVKMGKDYNDVFDNDVLKNHLKYIDDTADTLTVEPVIRHYKNLMHNKATFSSMLDDDVKFINNMLEHWNIDAAVKFDNKLAKAILSGLSATMASSSLLLSPITLALQKLSLVVGLTTRGVTPAFSKNEYTKFIEKTHNVDLTAKNLPAVSSRSIADISQEDYAGWYTKTIGALTSNTIGSYDRVNAALSAKGSINKYAKEIATSEREFSDIAVHSMMRKVQDHVDMEFGGFDRIDRPELFKSQFGKHLMAFKYPLIAQNNAILYSMLRAEGTSADKAVAAVRAATAFATIVYVEQAMRGLNPDWMSANENHEANILSGLVGATGIPIISDLPFAFDINKAGDPMAIIGAVKNASDVVIKLNELYNRDENMKELTDEQKATKERQLVKASTRLIGIPNQLWRTLDTIEALGKGVIKAGTTVIPVIGKAEYLRILVGGVYGPIARKEYEYNKGIDDPEDMVYTDKEVQFVTHKNRSKVPTDVIHMAKVFSELTEEQQDRARTVVDEFSKTKMKKVDQALLQNFGHLSTTLNIKVDPSHISLSEVSAALFQGSVNTYKYVSKLDDERRAKFMIQLNPDAYKKYMKWDLANTSNIKGRVSPEEVADLWKELGAKGRTDTEDMEGIAYRAMVLSNGIPNSIVNLMQFTEEFKKSERSNVTQEEIDKFDKYLTTAAEKDNVPESIRMKHLDAFTTILNKAKAKDVVKDMEQMALDKVDYEVFERYFNSQPEAVKALTLSKAKTIESNLYKK